jgi:hypothetical protein
MNKAWAGYEVVSGELLRSFGQHRRAVLGIECYPGVWGGTWLEENVGLDKRKHSYAWGFDGVAEENSKFCE